MLICIFKHVSMSPCYMCQHISGYVGLHIWPHAVVRKLDSAIHQTNLYPVDSAIGFPNTYPMDSDLSSGYA